MNKKHDISVPGLRNTGQTCFLNAALQALAAAPQLCSFLQRCVTLRGGGFEDEAATSMIAALAGCLQSLQATSGSAKPKSAQDVLVALRGRRTDTVWVFEDNKQHDVCEAAAAILDAAADELRVFFDKAAVVQQTPSLRNLIAVSQQGHCIGASCDSSMPSPANLFRDWRLYTMLPSCGLLSDESLCLSCHDHSPRVLSPFTIIPLPIGPTLLQSIETFSALEYLLDVDCARCSLKASFRDVKASQLNEHARVNPGGGPLQHAHSGRPQQSPLQSTASMKQTLEHGAKPNMTDRQKLLALCEGASPLPPVDIKASALAAGLQWHPRRTSLFKLCAIAKLPEVLLFQFSRTQWLPSGRHAKDSSHVAFPEQLSAKEIFEAAPILPSVQTVCSYLSETRRTPPQSPAVHEASGDDPHSLPLAPSHVVVAEQSNTEGSTAKSLAYHLAAVVTHDGNTASGHYTTFRRVQTDSADSVVNWFRISDASVRLSTIQEVLAAEATLLVYIVNK